MGYNRKLRGQTTRVTFPLHFGLCGSWLRDQSLLPLTLGQMINFLCEYIRTESKWLKNELGAVVRHSCSPSCKKRNMSPSFFPAQQSRHLISFLE